MYNNLVVNRRIKVDFSQNIAKVWNWYTHIQGSGSSGGGRGVGVIGIQAPHIPRYGGEGFERKYVGIQGCRFSLNSIVRERLVKGDRDNSGNAAAGPCRRSKRDPIHTARK